MTLFLSIKRQSLTKDIPLRLRRQIAEMKVEGIDGGVEDVKVVEVDAHEWAIESVDGPELSDDAAAELCGDLARWSLTFSSHFRDIAAYLEPTKAVA